MELEVDIQNFFSSDAETLKNAVFPRNFENKSIIFSDTLSQQDKNNNNNKIMKFSENEDFGKSFVRCRKFTGTLGHEQLISPIPSPNLARATASWRIPINPLENTTVSIYAKLINP